MEPRDIVKGLLVHINQDVDCEICPYQNVSNCHEVMIKDTVRLIETLVRPQGEWISNGGNGIYNPGRHCSLCGKVVEFSENYCPKCGAVMRGNNNG